MTRALPVPRSPFPVPCLRRSTRRRPLRRRSYQTTAWPGVIACCGTANINLGAAVVERAPAGRGGPVAVADLGRHATAARPGDSLTRTRLIACCCSCASRGPTVTRCAAASMSTTRSVTSVAGRPGAGRWEAAEPGPRGASAHRRPDRRCDVGRRGFVGGRGSARRAGARRGRRLDAALRQRAVGFGTCCTIDDLHDARRVAARIGIPHYIVNFESHFHAHVQKNFIAEYARGRTPIPCAHCNSEVKFSELLARAGGYGASQLATGHYARLDRADRRPPAAAARTRRRARTRATSCSRLPRRSSRWPRSPSAT